MSYFSIKELIDAQIYDSEGLYYGSICGVEIEDKPRVKACLTFHVGEYVPDIDELKKMLKEKGLEIPEDITLEELVITARGEGLSIPKKVVEKRIDLVKGYIGLDEIAVIDIVYRKSKSYNWRVAVVVLNKPREAIYRGLPVPVNKPLIEAAEKALNKLVVSLTEGIIGYTEDLVFAPNDLGIRVEASNYRNGYILWNNFLALLKTRGEEDLVEILGKSIGSAERLDLHLYGYIYGLFDKYRVSESIYELLNNSIEFEEEIIEKYRDISWKNILRIGDIVIVK